MFVTRPILSAWLPAAALAMLSLSCAAATPKPPAKICIGSNCATAPTAGGMKWHPGHYMSLRGQRKPTIDLPAIDSISTETSLQGVLVEFRWADLETSEGKYDFSEIDTYLNRIKALKTTKRLVIRLEERSFGSVSPGQHAPVPEYLWTDPTFQGGDTPMSDGLVARIWVPAVMDRLIALYKALGAKYDSDPQVEGISSSETAVSFSTARPAPGGYSSTALLTQFQRLAIGARQAFPHSMVNIETNFLGSNDQMESLIKTLAENGGTAGGPDTGYDGKGASQSELIVSGQRGSGADYRGNVVVKSEVQSPDWKAGVADCNPAGIFATAYNTNHSNYVFWDRMTWSSDARQNWSTGILPYIRSINGKVYTGCPTTLSAMACSAN
jgi:hypothetical protein